MYNVSFAEVVNQLVAKQASVTLSAKQRFTYVPLPEDFIKKMEALQGRIVPADGLKQDIDHITVVFTPKAEDDIEPAKIEEVLKALREVAADTPPIHAKVQGWAYFDGAKKDGETKTALVGLIDAPGLEDLHVEMKSALKRAGFTPSTDHTFTPHFTFCYLKQGERVNDLPMLDGEFEIDKVCFAHKDVHDMPLQGSLGVKAAKWWHDLSPLVRRGLVGAGVGAVGGGVVGATADEGHVGRDALLGGVAGAGGGVLFNKLKPVVPWALPGVHDAHVYGRSRTKTHDYHNTGGGTGQPAGRSSEEGWATIKGRDNVGRPIQEFPQVFSAAGHDVSHLTVPDSVMDDALLHQKVRNQLSQDYVPSSDSFGGKAEPIAARVPLEYGRSLQHDSALSAEENELRRLLRRQGRDAEMPKESSLGVKAAMSPKFIKGVVGRTLETNPDRLAPFFSRMSAIGSPKALQARSYALGKAKAHMAGHPSIGGARTGNIMPPVSGGFSVRPPQPGPPMLQEPSVRLGELAAKYAMMTTRPIRARPLPMMPGVAAGSGPALNPVKFTPGPNTLMGRSPQVLPPGMQPTPYTPPSRETQFAMANAQAPVGGAPSGVNTGYHFDPFGGGEFRVKRATLQTLLDVLHRLHA